MVQHGKASRRTTFFLSSGMFEGALWAFQLVKSSLLNSKKMEYWFILACVLVWIDHLQRVWMEWIDCHGIDPLHAMIRRCYRIFLAFWFPLKCPRNSVCPFVCICVTYWIINWATMDTNSWNYLQREPVGHHRDDHGWQGSWSWAMFVQQQCDHIPWWQQPEMIAMAPWTPM